MKKIMLTVAVATCIGAAAMAQSTPSRSTPNVEQTNPTTRSKDWIKLETDKIPSSLQQTLKDDKYKGWENSGVYYNKSTRQYSVDSRDNGSTNTYNFDSNGIAIPNPMTPGTSPTAPPSGTRPNNGTIPNNGSTPNGNGVTPGSSVPNP